MSFTILQILLKDYRNDITPILEGMTNMPYDGSGWLLHIYNFFSGGNRYVIIDLLFYSGTHTGNALKHALEVMLAEENGNRPGVKDVLFLITDGFSQDSVDVPAKKLRSAGVKVIWMYSSVLPIISGGIQLFDTDCCKPGTKITISRTISWFV